jgi:hypothetical protein
MFIADGTGKGFQVGVTKNNQLSVQTENIDESSIISQRDGQYFIWTSTYNATANDFVLYLKNISATKILKVRKIAMGNSVASTWQFHKVLSGTPSGTLTTGYNLCIGDAKTPEAISYGNAAITGLTTQSVIHWMHAAGAMFYCDTQAAVLVRPNEAIALRVLNTGTVVCYMSCYYIDL